MQRNCVRAVDSNLKGMFALRGVRLPAQRIHGVDALTD
jgi:hypothetical protein